MKFLNIIGLGAVLYVNYLANAQPINGLTTGEISNMYPSLFTPAGITFSIWGIIYLLLLGFVIFALVKPYQNDSSINPLFLLTCVCNISWIFAWHYLQTGLSVLIMIVFLISLIAIFRKLPRPSLSAGEYWLVVIPFSVYLAWICIATVANMSAYLLDLGFNPSIAPYLTSLVIGVLMIVLFKVEQIERNWAFTLTVLWALGGIILARSNEAQPNSLIIATAAVAMIIAIVLTLRAPSGANA